MRRAAAGSNRSHFARGHWELEHRHGRLLGDFNQLKVTINGRSLRSRSQQLFSAGDVKLGVGTRSSALAAGGYCKLEACFNIFNHIK